jgi:phage baseplate assembly protein W
MALPVDPLDRFGTGVAIPFRVGPSGVEKASGIEKVLMCVAQVIGTPTGKLPWRAKFGCRITRLRHMNNSNGLQTLARVDCQDALRAWEPRARLRSLTLGQRDSSSRNILDLTAQVTVAGKTQTVKASL